MAEMGKHRYEYDSDEDTEVIQNAVHVIEEEQKSAGLSTMKRDYSIGGISEI